MIQRLALGTAQFGLNYGISNKSGKVSEEEVAKILCIAQSNGISTLDTAINYGNSEAVLGEVGVKGWDVISKLPSFPEECSDLSGWVREQLEATLERLQLSSLKGLLLHHPIQLFDVQGDSLYRALQDMKEQGLVQQVGVSIYEPLELDKLLSVMNFDLVQAPFNILDHRMEASHWVTKLDENDIELHTRSVFLQGLLLMSPSDRPKYFNRWTKLFQEWDAWLADHKLTPMQACLRYVLSQKSINRVVVGVDSAQQLQEIISSARGNMPTLEKSFDCVDLDLLNPSKWLVQ